MANVRTRRTFLQMAPLAAAASLSLAEAPLLAEEQSEPVPFQLVTGASLHDAIGALQATPGNKTLFEAKPLPITIVLTTETAKSAKEFEWHEGRDHILQVIEGATRYELGGTPKNGRNIKPGEWLAPGSDGAKTVMLGKGDLLVIPRGTPHKRSTEGSVTFTLISTVGDPA